MEKSTILFAQLKTDVVEMTKNYDAGLYQGLYGVNEYLKDQTRLINKLYSVFELMFEERKQYLDNDTQGPQ